MTNQYQEKIDSFMKIGDPFAGGYPVVYLAKDVSNMMQSLADYVQKDTIERAIAEIEEVKSHAVSDQVGAYKHAIRILEALNKLQSQTGEN